MKIPKKQEMAVGSAKLNDFTVPYTEAWTYSRYKSYNHENRLFGEIAGHVFNKYLNVRQEKGSFQMGTRFRFRFSGTNPNKAGLWLEQIVNDLDLAQTQSSNRLMEVVYEDAVEELIHKALEAVDIVHNLKGSFWKKLRFISTKRF